MLSSKCPDCNVGSQYYCIVSKLCYQCWIEEGVASYLLIDVTDDMQLKIKLFLFLFE